MATHSTSLVTICSGDFHSSSPAKYPQLLLSVVHAFHGTGVPSGVWKPSTGITCSGETKSPQYVVGSSVTMEPMPSPLVSRRLSMMTSGWSSRTIRTSSAAPHSSGPIPLYEKSNHGPIPLYEKSNQRMSSLP